LTISKDFVCAAKQGITFTALQTNQDFSGRDFFITSWQARSVSFTPLRLPGICPGFGIEAGVPLVRQVHYNV
jgi:hypothetical protein